MNIRSSRLATGLLVVAALVLMSGRCFAIRHGLPASKDNWGLKYDVSVEDTGDDMLTIEFTLANEGRLKPIYSIDLVAFSKQTDSQGGRSYDVLEPIKFKPAEDGRRVGQVQMRKEFLDRAKIRIITLTLDGKRQPSGGVFYDIPVAKYVNGAKDSQPEVARPLPPRRPTKVTK